MLQVVILLLYFTCILMIKANGQCIQEIISNNQYTCGQSSPFISTSAGFPSKLLNGVQEMSITGTIIINDTCSLTYPFNFFALKITPENQGEVVIAYFQVSGQKNMALYHQDLTGIKIVSSTITVSAGIGQNTVLEFFISFNLATGWVVSSLALNTNLRNYGQYKRSFTGWKFDKTTRFEFCSDSSGNSVASCFVQSLAIEYKYISSPLWDYLYIGGVDPVRIASYDFDKKSGKSVTDNSNTLGPAQFGTATTVIPNGKSPQWVADPKDVGVEFTDSDQYITIPTFTPASSNKATSFLFTISFWLKLESGANDGYLFRYSRPNLGGDLFALSIMNNQELNFAAGMFPYSDGQKIPYSVWNLLTVSYVCVTSMTMCFTQAYLNSTLLSDFNFYTMQTPYYQWQASDMILIGGPGGFKGKLASFRIYNRGSQRIINPDCEATSTCLLNMGYVDSTNKNCLLCNSKTLKFYEECDKVTCPDGTYLSGNQCIEIAEEEEEEEEKTFPGQGTSKGTTAAAKGMTQAVSAVSSGGSAGATAAISGKVFSNIKFINISYPSELENALETWNPNYLSVGVNGDMPGDMEKRFVNSTVPYVFAKHQVNSCFLVNFWEPLIMLVILVLLFLVVLLLDWLISYWKKDKKSLQYRIITRVKVMVLNFLIVQLYGMYGDVVFYALIEFQNQRLLPGLNLLSVFAILIVSGAMMFGFFLHINLLKRYQNVKRNFGGNAETKQHFDNWIKDHAGIQVIFGDFKDYSLAHQSFLLILTVRDILFSLILATLFDHPLVECILILLMNIAMLAYLFIKRPFKEIVAQVQQVVLELITMVVNVSVLILAAFDANHSEAFDQRKTIGKLLIVINMIFNFIVAGFMLLILFLQGWEIYKDYKSRRQEKKLRIKPARNVFSLQNIASLDSSSKSPSKGLDNDLKVTEFVRSTTKNNSETCQPMNKTPFEDTILLNHPQRSTLVDENEVRESTLEASMVMMSSSRNGQNEFGQLESSSIFPNSSSLSGVSLVKSLDPTRQQIRKRRRLDHFK